MAIGERIHYFRTMLGLTQKQLGSKLGFSDSQADVRIAQYESGKRNPKQNYTDAIANIFNISPNALTVPDIDSYIGLMHTLFALEDMYGLTVKNSDDGICLQLDKLDSTSSISLHEMLSGWCEQAELYRKGEISEDEYDLWRYNYPKFDNSSPKAHVPSKALNDMLLETFKKELK